MSDLTALRDDRVRRIQKLPDGLQPIVVAAIVIADALDPLILKVVQMLDRTEDPYKPKF